MTFKEYFEKFGLGQKEIEKIKARKGVKSIEVLEQKVKFYMDTFGLSEEKVIGMIVKCPEILGNDTISDSPTSMKSKIKFYQEHLGLKIEDVAKMIEVFPAFLNYGIDEAGERSLITKTKYLKQILSEENIVKNAKNYVCPALRTKIRFMLLSEKYPESVIASGNRLMTSENKLWARKSFFESKGLYKLCLTISEEQLIEDYKVTTEELIEKYPITATVIGIIEEDYFRRTGAILKLDERERCAVLKASGQLYTEEEIE